MDSRENETSLGRRATCANWKLVDALAVNTYDVMNHGTLVLSKEAFGRVVATLGGE